VLISVHKITAEIDRPQKALWMIPVAAEMQHSKTATIPWRAHCLGWQGHFLLFAW